MTKMTAAILTDAQGRPFERPESPGANATLEQRLAYLRAVWAFNDAVSDCANTAFSKALGKALKSR